MLSIPTMITEVRHQALFFMNLWLTFSLYLLSGPVSRIEASKLILSKVQTVGQSKALVLLMGDFNSESTDGGYQTLTGGEYKSLYTPTYIVSHLASRAHFLDAEQELLTRSESSAKGFPPLLHRHFGETYSNPGFPRDKMKPKNIDFILFLDNGAVSPKKKGISSEPDKWQALRSKSDLNKGGSSMLQACYSPWDHPSHFSGLASRFRPQTGRVRVLRDGVNP